MGTRWDMHASRKVLLKHFNARATEYRDDIVLSENMKEEGKSKQTDNPVSISLWSNSLNDSYKAFH